MIGHGLFCFFLISIDKSSLFLTFSGRDPSSWYPPPSTNIVSISVFILVAKDRLLFILFELKKLAKFKYLSLEACWGCRKKIASDNVYILRNDIY